MEDRGTLRKKEEEKEEKRKRKEDKGREGKREVH